jgi:catechol 2,3-dioxygenase-like lactoylglutathione lyase family enzyme
MAVSRFSQWTLDVHDVERMAAFWSQALGYRIQPGDDGDAHLLPPDDRPGQLTVWLQPTDAPKVGKNRDHMDLVADAAENDGDVEAEVERLIGLGARRADVGQTGDEGFVVLADPEGNEFCLLYRR